MPLTQRVSSIVLAVAVGLLALSFSAAPFGVGILNGFRDWPVVPIISLAIASAAMGAAIKLCGPISILAYRGA